MKELGERIRARRIELGLKQEDLAERLAVTRQTISNYERGTSEPDLDTLQKLAEALQIDLNQLLKGEKAPEQNRKKARLPFVLGILATSLLFVLFLSLSDWAVGYKAYTYDPKPFLKVYMLLLPAVMLALGWTLVQGAACLTDLPTFPPVLRVMVRLVIAWMILSYAAGAVPWLWDLSFKAVDADHVEAAFAWAQDAMQRWGVLFPLLFGAALRLTRRPNKDLTNGKDMV